MLHKDQHAYLAVSLLKHLKLFGKASELRQLLFDVVTQLFYFLNLDFVQMHEFALTVGVQTYCLLLPYQFRLIFYKI